MQIFAFDSKGKLISAIDAERKKDYLCPECQRCVHLRGGNQRRVHFYHTQASNCRLSQKNNLHLAIQLFLSQLIPPEECHLEKPFFQIRRIADCVWETKKIIFEIQCSPISKEEVKKRMKDYSSCGYILVWILHESAFPSHGHSTAVHFLKKFSHYYTNINLAGKGIFYDRYKEYTFPVNLSKPSYEQLRCQLKERRKWKVHFEGDIISKKWKAPLKKKNLLYDFFRGLAHFLLVR